MIAAILVLLLGAHELPAQRGVVTTATAFPNPAQVGTPVTLGVTGKNPCNAVQIDWGDGTVSEYQIPDLTTTQKHTFERPGRYAIVARGVGSNCEGGTTLYLRVEPAPAPGDRPQLSSFTVSMPAPAGSPIGVTAFGKGNCRFMVDFGDGKSEEFTVPLPHTVRHTYAAPGSYNVVANAAAPCEGRHTVKLEIGGEPNARAGPRLLGLRITPNPAAPRTRVAIRVDGAGTCSLTVDFGDGTDQTLETTLPARISHTYSRTGTYEIFAWSEEPCSGEATASVRVRRY